jgi:hypothetical protein
MSETLRTNEGVDEVADQGHRGDEGEQVLPVHDVLPSGLLDEGQPDEDQRGQRQHDGDNNSVHPSLFVRYRYRSALTLTAGHKDGVKETLRHAKKSSSREPGSPGGLC